MKIFPFKQKRKNLDMDSVRQLSKIVADEAQQRKRKYIERITREIVSKVAQKRFRVDRDGRICVYVFHCKQKLETIEAVNDELRKIGFTSVDYDFGFPFGIHWKMRA